MTPNPYQVFGNPTPQMLGRSRLAERVLDRLRTQHVSVVGPRYVGKKVFLNGILVVAKASRQFDDVVYWDLRRFSPETDGQFFAQMAEKLRDQITSVGDDIHVFFSKPEDLCWSSIKSLAEHYRDNKKRVLVVFDGMDQALASHGLGRGVWDNLCSLADQFSVTMLTSSRKRLRQLCADPTSRTSDFWERFVDPVELKVFTQEELKDFVTPLNKAVREFSAGVETEIWNWSGGVPVLAAAMSQVLASAASPTDSISTASAHQAAKHVLEHHLDLIEALWQDLDIELQTAFVELVRAGELSRADLAAMASKLINAGLASEQAGKLKPRCRLLAEFSSSREQGLAVLRSLFGSQAAFEQNIRAFLELRLSQVACNDKQLVEYVKNAIEKVTQPQSCLVWMRSIAEHALDIIWKIESPTGQVPRFTPIRESNIQFGQLPSGDSSRLCLYLNFLTDPRYGVPPQKANRKIYCLVSDMKALGDFGQHYKQLKVDTSFSALACLSAIQLIEEIVAVGLA